MKCVSQYSMCVTSLIIRSQLILLLQSMSLATITTHLIFVTSNTAKKWVNISDCCVGLYLKNQNSQRVCFITLFFKRSHAMERLIAEFVSLSEFFQESRYGETDGGICVTVWVLSGVTLWRDWSRNLCHSVSSFSLVFIYPISWMNSLKYSVHFHHKLTKHLPFSKNLYYCRNKHTGNHFCRSSGEKMPAQWSRKGNFKCSWMMCHSESFAMAQVASLRPRTGFDAGPVHVIFVVSTET
jgi:hypothetical protein